jgi:hypothetical protein
MASQVSQRKQRISAEGHKRSDDNDDKSSYNNKNNKVHSAECVLRHTVAQLVKNFLSFMRKQPSTGL